MDVGIATLFDNLITNLKPYTKPLGFTLPDVDDSILLVTKDGCSDIVTVLMVGDTWLSVEVEDIDTDDYGNTYVVQYSDIDYIVNFGDDECTVMSDEELIKHMNDELTNHLNGTEY